MLKKRALIRILFILTIIGCMDIAIADQAMDNNAQQQPNMQQQQGNAMPAGQTNPQNSPLPANFGRNNPQEFAPNQGNNSLPVGNQAPVTPGQHEPVHEAETHPNMLGNPNGAAGNPNGPQGGPNGTPGNPNGPQANPNIPGANPNDSQMNQNYNQAQQNNYQENQNNYQDNQNNQQNQPPQPIIRSGGNGAPQGNFNSNPNYRSPYH